MTNVCDHFDFHIVNFPFLDFDGPRRPSYGVTISQLIGRLAPIVKHLFSKHAYF